MKDAISKVFTKNPPRSAGRRPFCMAVTLSANAQVQTYIDVDNGPTTQEVKIERGVVVYVSGNDVVIKGEDGRIRDFPNVPESARVTVDGQQLSVHDVRPGMTIERTTITTTTPRVITTIKTVTGRYSVLRRSPNLCHLDFRRRQESTVPCARRHEIHGRRTTDGRIFFKERHESFGNRRNGGARDCDDNRSRAHRHNANPAPRSHRCRCYAPRHCGTDCSAFNEYRCCSCGDHGNIPGGTRSNRAAKDGQLIAIGWIVRRNLPFAGPWSKGKTCTGF